MKGYFDNLRPFEKRVVVGVGVMFFIVLNMLFVWPRFSDWDKVQGRMFEARRKLRLYENEQAMLPRYQRDVRALEDEGLAVPQEEQSLHFASAIQSQAAQSRVSIISNSKISTRTNQFFLESTQGISVQGGEEQLVNFLYSLGAGNSLIRVRDLSLHPDAPRQQLAANVKLVASYQKKVTAKAAPATTPARPSPRSQTAAAPAGSPASVHPVSPPPTANTKRP